METLVISMKPLDLAIGWKGGTPSIFARNVELHGDHATIAFIVGSLKGEIIDNGKYLINLNRRFNSPEYLKQIKDYLTKINNTISFANDQPSGSFINPNDVLNKADEIYKLMNFEKKAILDDLEKLHLIYVSAIRNNFKPELPDEFNYEVNSGGLYPIRQVYSAICALTQ
jgi:hypothetical protein